MKRALVVGPGGLRGSYEAGVLATLCRELGPNYFNSIYACSSGAFSASYFAANQPENIEKVWRDYVCGNQLINFLNPLHHREILNLEYLVEIYKGIVAHLNVDAALRSGIDLHFVVTDINNDTARYLQPDKKIFFDVVRASAAIPGLHASVKIGHAEYIDGGISDPIPIQKALEDGFDEIIVVSHSLCGKLNMFEKLFIELFYPHLSKLMARKDLFVTNLEMLVKSHKNIKVIRSNKLPMLYRFDRDKRRINKTFDKGVHDTYKFLKNL